MKESVPACPHCRTKTYVVRDRSAEKTGALLGGAIGAGAAWLVAKDEEKEGLCFLLLSAGALAASLSTIMLGFLSGSVTGSAIGEQVDSRLCIQYRCNRCGWKVKG